MDDLITDFIAESREMLDMLGGEIVAWESAPKDRERLDAIFRFVHTVKGNCGFFDLPRLKALSHAAEDALAAVRSGKREADHQLVSAVLAIIDRIGELVQALETGEAIASEDDESLIAALSESQPEEIHVSGAATAGPQRSAMRTIRLPVDLLDRMMSGVSDLVLARNELARRLRESPAGVEVDSTFERVSATIAEMRDAITRTRMQRIDNLFAPLPRMVRDLSAETGKQVSLEIDGGDVELDREMIEMIRDPLTHIVRNAIDHGIESAADRRSAGKPESGVLAVCARQAGNQILIEIRDDGRGIDGDALVRKALAAGTLTKARAERLGPAQKTALIFEAGLSTAAQVTEISGRGVGMDVVRANIERIGGIVDVDSEPGKGVRLTLRVPLTLTIIPALTVSAGGGTYALPRSAIEEIVRATGEGVRIEAIGGARMATVRGRRVPLVCLGSVLGTAGADEAEQKLILLKPAGSDIYALAVDQVHDHEELVVKPAAPAVMAAGLYAGTTLADDGRPVLLLDPPGIAARAGIALERRDTERVEATAAPSEAGIPALMFLTLAGAKSVLPLSAIERIEDVPAESIQRSGGRLHVAVDGRILPLEGCEGVAPEGGLRILRLTDGAAQIAYGFDRVVDIVSLGSDVRPVATSGEVRGVTLIGDDQVEVIDLHWLFAAHSGARAETDLPICLLPAGDPWMDNILRPIIESAGYCVVRTGEQGADRADVVIIAEDEAPPIESGDAVIVRLRSDLASAGGKDGSIHRYDRAALIGALGNRKRGKA